MQLIKLIAIVFVGLAASTQGARLAKPAVLSQVLAENQEQNVLA